MWWGGSVFFDLQIGEIDGCGGGDGVHYAGGEVVGAGDIVRVCVHEGGEGFSEDVGNLDRGCVVHEHDGGGCMADIVKADARKAGIDGQCTEVFCEVIAVERGSEPAGEE